MTPRGMGKARVKRERSRRWQKQQKELKRKQGKATSPRRGQGEFLKG